MTDEKPLTFDEWWKSTLFELQCTPKRCAEMAWKAATDQFSRELAALKESEKALRERAEDQTELADQAGKIAKAALSDYRELLDEIEKRDPSGILRRLRAERDRLKAELKSSNEIREAEKKILIAEIEKNAALAAEAEAMREWLKAQADNAYCKYIEQSKREECLGWEEKVRAGEFGKDELDAHCERTGWLGKHKAFHEALSAHPGAVEGNHQAEPGDAS